MIYVADTTFPANGAASSLTRQVLKVTKGLVYRVEFWFPPACEGLVHVALFDGGWQWLPTTRGVYLAANAAQLSFDDLYFKTTPPYEFTIQGYNTDDTFNHVLQIRLGMVSTTQFIARFLPGYAPAESKALLTSVEEEQKLLQQELLERG